MNTTLAQVEAQLKEASEAYKSGQVASAPALAKVRKLVKRKIFLQGMVARA